MMSDTSDESEMKSQECLKNCVDWKKYTWAQMKRLPSSMAGLLKPRIAALSEEVMKLMMIKDDQIRKSPKNQSINHIAFYCSLIYIDYKLNLLPNPF